MLLHHFQIDPIRTISAGKVDIGAFRTYPKGIIFNTLILHSLFRHSNFYLGYKPPDEPMSEYQTIPINKIEDFGVHCKQACFFSFYIFITHFSFLNSPNCSTIPWTSPTSSRRWTPKSLRLSGTPIGSVSIRTYFTVLLISSLQLMRFASISELPIRSFR
jgi:hypothetical protein